MAKLELKIDQNNAEPCGNLDLCVMFIAPTYGTVWLSKSVGNKVYILELASGSENGLWYQNWHLTCHFGNIRNVGNISADFIWFILSQVAKSCDPQYYDSCWCSLIET